MLKYRDTVFPKIQKCREFGNPTREVTTCLSSATLKNIATDHATWRRSEHRVHTVQNVQFVRSVAFCVAAPLADWFLFYYNNN